MSNAAEPNSPALVRIDVTRTEDTVTVSGVVEGVEKASLEAELTVERTGVAGNATLHQRKHVDVAPGGHVVFGEVSVSFASGDSLIATATLSSGDEIIAETRTIIGTGKNKISGGN